MRDIKTRESRVGSVKTIDRASMLSYRMKQATIKAREQTRDTVSGNDQNEVSYAQENMFSVVEESAATVGDVAETGFIRGKEFAKKTISDRKLMKEAEEYYQNSRKTYGNDPVFSEKGADTGHLSSQTGKKNAEKVIGDSSFFAEKGVNDVSNRTRASFAKAPAKVTGSNETKRAVKLTQTIPKEKAETVMKRQYQLRKAREAAIRRAEKAGKGFLVAVRKAVESTKFIVGSLSVVGSIALIAIIVCTFFGSAFYILGDESNPDYIPGEFVGVGNEAIVEVAAAQVGNVGGGPYWSWYGFYDRVEWCACFVSWCANQCGYIKDGIIPKFAVVGHGMNWFQKRGQWQGRGYHPQPGDIIFFDWDGDGLGNHVGIVESSDDTYVYTIEGNSGDRCRRRTYFISSSMIMGYGIPAYSDPVAVDPDENIIEK